ncbi:Ig-like domain-containing protein [Paenibacillus puerhi]|uniref:Ig-like domain-containing protein n=1 Tax=Paenibacillus puerhi TaxID=2692622 RepID=UPI0013593596|nr:Ig-like domain-containing protein [Paenibacillus puerhi]
MRFQWIKIMALTLIVALGAGGFSGAQAVAATETISSLVLNKNELALEVGATATLTATAVYVSGTTENVSVKTDWNSGEADTASVYAGVVTAKKEGKAVITATYMGKTVIVNVTVTKRVRSLIKDKQLIDLRQGQSEQVTLTAYYDDGSHEDVTSKADWNIDNGSIATVINGKVTGQSSGSTVITAKYNSQQITIPVNVEIVKRVDPEKTEVSLLQGETESVKLMATYPDGTVEDVSDKADWVSDDSEVADVIKGKITGYGPGQASIKATYGTKSTTIKVDVDHAIKIELDKQSLFMKKGDTSQLKLTATYAEGNTEDVTAKAEWTSEDEGIVYVIKGKLSANGTGETTVTVKYGNKTVQAKIDVDVPRRLELGTEELFLKTGESGQLSLQATYADDTEEDVTRDAKWSIEDTAIAGVTNGKVTAYKAGVTKVTATYGGREVTASISVDVPVKLSASHKIVQFQVGSSEQITLKAIYVDGREEDITSKAVWSSGDAGIAEVRKGLVSGVGTGATTVKAAFGTRTVTVQVSVGVLKTLTVDQSKLVMAKNESKSLSLKATYTDGTTADVASEAVWTTSDSKVALVTEEGKVTAVQTGEAKITVTFGGKTVEIVVQVDMAGKLVASPMQLSFDLGETRAIVLTATDSNGTSKSVSQEAEWKSGDDKIAQVTNGVVTAIARGKTTITAIYGGKSVSIPVEIGVVQSLEVDKKFISTKRGDSVQIRLTAVLSDGTKKDMTESAAWRSSNYKVADVTEGLVTAVDSGSAIIVVSYAGKSVNIPVEIDKLKYLKTSEVAIELKKGATFDVKAIATYFDGTDQDVTVEGLWSSTNIRVADVKDGIIKATGKGKATVSVTYAKKRTTVVVTVTG